MLGPSTLRYMRLARVAVHPQAQRLQVQHDVGDVLAHAGDRRELVQHAVDLDRGDRRTLQRRQQHPPQRVAQRDAEAALERLDDDRRLAVGPASGLHVEPLRLDQILPVLLDHGATSLSKRPPKRLSDTKRNEAPTALAHPRASPRSDGERRREAGARRGAACAAGSHCAGSASRRGSSVIWKPDRLQRPQCRLRGPSPGPRTCTSSDLHAVLGGLAAGLLGRRPAPRTASTCASP